MSKKFVRITFLSELDPHTFLEQLTLRLRSGERDLLTLGYRGVHEDHELTELVLKLANLDKNHRWCWCQVWTGNPIMLRHSDVCERLRGIFTQ
jgi:hypothetical protein